MKKMYLYIAALLLISVVAVVWLGTSRNCVHCFSDDFMRDQTRVQDIMQIQAALQQYHQNTHQYPQTLAGLSPQYLSSVPTDPKTHAPYVYTPIATPASLTYKLCARLEDIRVASSSAYCIGAGQTTAAESAPTSPATSTASLDTATWKTYRDDTHGFEIKYPPDWQVLTDDTVPSLGERIELLKPKGNAYFNIRILLSQGNLSADVDTTNFDSYNYTLTRTPMAFDGLPAVRSVYAGDANVNYLLYDEIVVDDGGYAFVLPGSIDAKAGKDMTKQIFGAMLSSFTFTGQTQLPPQKQAIQDQYAKERAQAELNPGPVWLSYATSTVALGQVFTVRPRERVFIGNTGYVIEFQIPNPTIGEPAYQLVDGNDVPGINAPYDVVVKDTDGKTYTTLVVYSMADECAAKFGSEADQCWDALATHTNDPAYCSKASVQSAKDACLEDVAPLTLDDKQTCQQVINPKSYCQIYAPHTWVTYHDSAYGFSVKYPPGYLTASSSNDGSEVDMATGYAGISFQIVPFNTIFHDSFNDYDLQYDKNSNVWMKKNYDANTFTPSCETASPIGTTTAAYYDVSSFHTPIYAVLLKQGILQISYGSSYDGGNMDPRDSTFFKNVFDTLTFDNASSTITAQCP